MRRYLPALLVALVLAGSAVISVTGYIHNAAEVEKLRKEMAAQRATIDALKAETPTPEVAIVVNKANKQGDVRTFGTAAMWPYCITYRIAGSTEESCRFFIGPPSNGSEGFPGATAQGRAIVDCWTPVRVGGPIPECWQIGSPTTNIR